MSPFGATATGSNRTTNSVIADAIWWSFPIGSGTSMLLLVAYYRFGGWKKARMLEDQVIVEAI